MHKTAFTTADYPYPLVSKRLRRSIFSEESHSVVENYLNFSESIGDQPSGLKITIIRQNHILLEVPRSAYKKVIFGHLKPLGFVLRLL